MGYEIQGQRQCPSSPHYARTAHCVVIGFRCGKNDSDVDIFHWGDNFKPLHSAVLILTNSLTQSQHSSTASCPLRLGMIDRKVPWFSAAVANTLLERSTTG